MYSFDAEESHGLLTLPEEISVLPDVFLKRLRRLLVLRYQASHYLDDDDVRLLDRCILTTFCDCKEVGADEPARELLVEARAAALRRSVQ